MPATVISVNDVMIVLNARVDTSCCSVHQELHQRQLVVSEGKAKVWQQRVSTPIKAEAMLPWLKMYSDIQWRLSFGGF